MEKSLRVLGGDEGEGHSHSHSHSHTADDAVSTASGAKKGVSENGLRSRGEKGKKKGGSSSNGDSDVKQSTSASGPSKLSAYLNLFGDFVHNMYVLLLSFLNQLFKVHDS